MYIKVKKKYIQKVSKNYWQRFRIDSRDNFRSQFSCIPKSCSRLKVLISNIFFQITSKLFQQLQSTSSCKKSLPTVSRIRSTTREQHIVSRNLQKENTPTTTTLVYTILYDKRGLLSPHSFEEQKYVTLRASPQVKGERDFAQEERRTTTKRTSWLCLSTICSLS